MLLYKIKNIKSTKKDLRNFGLVIGIALGILGAILWWKGRETFPVFLALSPVFLLTGFLFPLILKPLQKIWMVIAVIMGWFMTRVLLSIVFYLLFTLIGSISRLFGKKFLNTGFNNSQTGYWSTEKRKPLYKSY